MDPAPNSRPADALLAYLGHATVLLELDGVRLLTDPVLRGWIGPLRRRGARPDLGRLADLDAILISHLHIDHFDGPSLRLLDHATRVIGPVGSGKLLRRRRFTDVVELSAGERVGVGAVEVTAVSAVHAGARHPLAADTPSLGFVVAGSRSVYFAGDTALFDGMDGLWPGLDVALLPIAGWGPTLEPDEHMGPDQAAEAVRLLRPRVAVPIHWGTFALPGSRLLRREPGGEEAARAFVDRSRELSPGVSAVLVRPAEGLDLATMAVLRPSGPPGDGPDAGAARTAG